MARDAFRPHITTYDISLTNFSVTTDITNAPPGQTQVVVTFDYSIRNTTAGRRIPNVVIDFFLAYSAETCGGTATSPVGTYNCYSPVAVFPGASPEDGTALDPGGVINGHYDWNKLALSVRGTYFATIPETLSVDDLFFGYKFFGCQSTCWISLAGHPVPNDLG